MREACSLLLEAHTQTRCKQAACRPHSRAAGESRRDPAQSTMVPVMMRRSSSSLLLVKISTYRLEFCGAYTLASAACTCSE